MNLRTKMLLMMTVLFAALTLAFYVLTSGVLLKGFSDVEKDAVRENVGRVSEALNDRVAALDRSVKDWAWWDEVYTFVDDGNKAFIESNMSIDSLEVLGIDAIAFVRSSGEMTFCVGIDRANHRFIPPSVELTDVLSKWLPLGESGGRSGVLLPGDRAMIVASRPILTSQQKGPVRGTLVMGVNLDAAEISRLGSITRSSIRIERIDDPALPPDFVSAKTELMRAAPICVQTLGRDSIAGYTAVNDLNGRPALLLRVDMARPIMAHARKALAADFGFMVAVGFIFSVIVMFHLDKQVLSRLLKLSGEVSSIGLGGVPAAHLSVDGRDEIADLASSVNQMLDGLDAASSAAVRARDEWEMTFNTIPDLVAIMDAEHRITRINKAMADQLGVDPSRVIGRHCYEVVHGTSGPPPFCPHAQTLLDGCQHSGEILEERLRGIFSVSMSPLRDSSGKFLGSVHVARDITERKKVEEEVRRLNEELEDRVKERTAELEAANEELESFCYSVSHDLRTPLRAIDGFSHAVLEESSGKLAADSESNLGRVRAAAQRMGRLIDSLLALSRLSRREMRRERVDLSQIARWIVQELQKKVPGREVSILIEDGAIANGDPELLRIVLENLFSNAWKFTSKHAQAIVEFGVTRRDGKTAYFVRDDGEGFDMAYADKLFGAFQRLHAESEFEGTGIGLAVVQRIIHRHGGRVWAEAEVGKGATFYFTI